MEIALHASGAVARSLTSLAARIGARVDSAAALALHADADGLRITRDGMLLHRMERPVRPAVLARLLIQSDQPAHAALQGGWQFDPLSRQLTREGEAHTLTEKEALLLSQLLRAHPQACPRERLLKEVWGMQAAVETHTLETHIYRLRQKLGELTPKPCDILTVDSAYRLTMETA